MFSRTNRELEVVNIIFVSKKVYLEANKLKLAKQYEAALELLKHNIIFSTKLNMDEIIRRIDKKVTILGKIKFKPRKYPFRVRKDRR